MATVVSVAVAAPARRHGLGRRLVQRALEHVATTYPAVVSVRLQVRTDGVSDSGFAGDDRVNAARRLYAGLGFEARRTLWGYYGPERHAVEMVRSVGRREEGGRKRGRPPPR